MHLTIVAVGSRGDVQPFWGERVYCLGVGPHPIQFRKLTSKNLTLAIDRSLNDKAMRRNALALGEKLHQENGAGKAVEYIQAF
jgi:sterol 3beta-glucosyltransferase